MLWFKILFLSCALSKALAISWDLYPIQTIPYYAHRVNYIFFAMSGSDRDTFNILFDTISSRDKNVINNLPNTQTWTSYVQFGIDDSYPIDYSNGALQCPDCHYNNSINQNLTEAYIKFLKIIPKPGCPEDMSKYFVMVVSDDCKAASLTLNNLLKPDLHCPKQFYSYGVLLPQPEDVNNCETELSHYEIPENFYFFSNNDGFDEYADNHGKFYGTLAEASVVIFSAIADLNILTTFIENQLQILNFDNTCLYSNSSGYVMLAYQNQDHNTYEITYTQDVYPLLYTTNNYNINKQLFYDSWKVTQVNNAYKVTCASIFDYLRTLNELPEIENPQYFVILLDSETANCVNQVIDWKSKKRHVEIFVKITENFGGYSSFFSSLITMSNSASNHVNFFYNTTSESFYKNSVCRDHMETDNFASISIPGSVLTSIPTSTASTSTSPLLNTNSTILATTTSSSTSQPKKTHNVKALWFIILGLVLLVITIFGLSVFIYCIKIRRKSSQSSSNDNDIQVLQRKWGEYLLTPKELKIDFINPLGKGSNATVYKGILKNHLSFQVAIKIPTNYTEEEADGFLSELEVLLPLSSHPHIIKLYGWYLANGIPSLVTELAYTDLLNYVINLKEKGQTLIINEILMNLMQISSAIEYLHSKGIIHRDIACRNILLFHPGSTAKVTDFGLSCFKDDVKNLVVKKKFPFKWLPLEVIEHQQFSEKSDVWAFGIFCYEIFSYGTIPYATFTNNEVQSFLKSNQRLEKPVDTPDTIYNLMLACWEKDPKNRPSFENIYKIVKLSMDEKSLNLLNPF